MTNVAARTRILARLGVACCAVLLAAGCTSRQPEGEYVDQLERALAARNDVIRQLDEGELGDASMYDAAADDITEAMDQLDVEPPPKRYEDAHELLVQALDGLAVLLGKLGRCERLAVDRPQDARACRQSIGQDVFDGLRNDFRESDAIYREEGLTMSQLAFDGQGDAGSSSGKGDVLDEPSGS